MSTTGGCPACGVKGGDWHLETCPHGPGRLGGHAFVLTEHRHRHDLFRGTDGLVPPTFVPVPRDQDPYLKGEGGNCGCSRVAGDACPDCWRSDGEWHQAGCPRDRV